MGNPKRNKVHNFLQVLTLPSSFATNAGGSTRSMATGLSGSAFAAGFTLRDARTGKECGWEGKGVFNNLALSVRWAPCYPRMKEEWNEGSLPLNLFLPTSAALPCFPCCLIEWFWTSNLTESIPFPSIPEQTPLSVCDVPFRLTCTAFLSFVA